MTDRENNIRHISQFLRDIQQISEYSTNRNTFNININYYEKYYNGYDNESSDILLEESNRINRSPIPRDTPANRYYIEINGERVNVDRNLNAVNQQENTNSTDINTEVSNTDNNITNTESISESRNNNENNNENNNLRNNTLNRRQITIPVRTSVSNWIADLDNTYPVNLTNSLTDISNIINRTLNDNLGNMNLDNLNIEIDTIRNRNSGLSINDLNTKTSLIVYSTIDSESKETKCHICNEDYSDTDICRKNNLCGHYLHQTCLDNWYSSHNTCPICNRVV